VNVVNNVVCVMAAYDDGFTWTETCWSSFYNFNYFNNLRIL